MVGDFVQLQPVVPAHQHEHEVTQLGIAVTPVTGAVTRRPQQPALLVVPERRVPQPEASCHLTDRQSERAHGTHLALNPGSGSILAYVNRHPTTPRQDSAPWALVAAGLTVQLVGVATRGLGHALLADRSSGVLTEGRTFWIDHTISNAGVARLVVGSSEDCAGRGC